MKYIINPLTNEFYDISSDKGKLLLKNYIKYYQTGGVINECNVATDCQGVGIRARNAVCYDNECWVPKDKDTIILNPEYAELDYRINMSYEREKYLRQKFIKNEKELDALANNKNTRNNPKIERMLKENKQIEKFLIKII